MMADVNQLSALLASFVNQQSELLASFRSQASSAPSPQPSQTFNFEQFDESKEDFKVYRHRLENYFNLKNVIDGSPDVDKLKAQILINCIGSKYYQLLLCLTSPETPRDKTYSELVTLIENHLCPQPNECIEQHKFLSRMQAANETIAQYTVALRKLSSTCNFVCPEPTCKKSIAQVFLQAQFIRGLSDPTIREKLLQEKDLTFGNATKIALALEASKLGNRVLSSSTEGEVNKVTVSKPPRRQNSTSKNSTYTNRKPHKTKSKINYADLGLDGICLRCGLNNHLVKDCQKDRSTFKCSSCHKTGHVAKVCIITLTKNKKNKSVNLVIEDNDSSCGESQFSINHIVTINNTLLQGDNKLTVPIKIGSGTILFEIDTGSPISIINREATAIYWSFHRFYPYIYGRKFTLVTDNKPLCHIFSPKKKLPEITASRLLRYALFLSGFDYEIKYRRSQEHGNADYLSRAPLPVISNTTDIEYEISTPLFSGGKSPAENFLGRNLRTRLDLLHFRPPRSQNPNLQPAVPPSRILRLGDRVQSRNYGSSMHWKCGTVVDVLGRLHYLIELDDGYVIKRHIDQLRRTEVSPETITNRKILPNVTSLPDQASVTQNMLGRHYSQAEVVCKQPPALSTDCSGEAAPQLTSAIPSQISSEAPPANATPVVSTPSSQPRKSTRVRKPVVKLNL
ncbi:hypothetical protein ILUMI_14934 [Ignelater luminosus]|uniref:CCHC-type domain-containing protein n=1 Tax=Ignelater luminosus TaxID=2038154 RepID=A0A8K0G9L0_IGNLU|nr:hypothetical protein ILUMI_14934 [Ignelater luminosus]